MSAPTQTTSSAARPRASASGTRLGLPSAVRACLFDLDGVLTHTAELHAEAWKQMFDAFLRRRAEAQGTAFAPFESVDYLRYVDGKPRAAGVASFLAARGIALPVGEPDDPPGDETVQALGNRKNELLLSLIDEAGVDAYEGSIQYVHAVRDAGLATAVVSSSANCREVLSAARIAPLFEVVVDGLAVARDGLRGKPAPDAFLAAARTLGAQPGSAAVFEDAIAGVAAARAGRFRFVVGVDRADQRDQLADAGADIVVSDLAELLELPR